MNRTPDIADAALDKRRLRMWIRMLRTTRTVEARLREFLRDSYDTTLPRFDVLAALYRAEDGLQMSGLSKELLVSNGNVTGIVDRLVGDGLVQRDIVANDRRSMRVSLTAAGRKFFAKVADDHNALINDLFADIDGAELDFLADIFGKLKQKEEAQ